MATGVAGSPRTVATPSRPLRAYLALVGGIMCIGFTAIFTKWAAVPGPVAAAYRMSTSALILAVPFYLHSRRQGYGRRRPLPALSFGLASAGGLLFALNLALLNSALLLTSAATATILDNMAPLWVGLGALLLFRERLRGRYWAGLGLALIGAAVVTGFRPSAMASLNQGDVLAFVGALFYAAYLLVTQKARCDLDALSYLWPVVATAALALIVGSLALRLPLLGYSPRSCLALIGAGVISQTGGWLLINYALGYLPASLAAVMLLGQPVVTSLLSIPLLGESIALRQVLGGAIVLTGIYLCLARAGDAPREVSSEDEKCAPAL